ncbi:(S)-benzoin forming benzil reductase [Aquibacillus salsiterrae]|uniref:(S)-benzoin forming benzil reductase n=1 Tax=Aquibacillus salsiterrae TaxID=2950439 RepID=A0A9X3WCH9_9BACI|nr:(S)-benzoin forming benzil reductase [Aquibacillus salsiterrae]MDC3417302.1 (S)-benzoin forming benzil reductase [Aquibacillus salsiterrae]
MEYAVITGTSRGLGEAIVKLLIKQGIHIIGIARHPNDSIATHAVNYGVTYIHEICDLSVPGQVEATFNTIASKLAGENVNRVHLINNAAIVDPIEKAGYLTTESLQKHVNVNLLAPMATTNIFIKMANESNTPVIVTNVTSGAANRAVYGWSAYCSTKAGLDRFTQSVALEQEELGTNNKVILFNPGIMDTEMQAEIRSASKEAFKDIEKFKQYKENQNLRQSDIVAETLVKVLTNSATVINGKYYNVVDLLN